MKTTIHLLDVFPFFENYKLPLLCLCTAFVVTLISIPHIIRFIHRFQLFDVPNERKSHSAPIPTMGGMAIVFGLFIAMLLWFPFRSEPGQIAFFFSVFVLLILGIMDDRNDLSAIYKLVIQIALAFLIAIAGIRITSFEGLFGIHELPLYSQYFFTVITIVGVTNAFNLVDGIDGLAGGIAFMSLIILGLFLSLSGDSLTALVAFALAGGILAFLYFNLNPALIFMGDTGSLVIGFVISVLCIRLIQVNALSEFASIPNSPVFVLSLVLIPVFDALRVFGHRLWKGLSPMSPDKTHIHHLIIRGGFGHAFAAFAISFFHGIILMQAYFLRNLRQEYTLLIILSLMFLITYICSKSHYWALLRKKYVMRSKISSES